MGDDAIEIVNDDGHVVQGQVAGRQVAGPVRGH